MGKGYIYRRERQRQVETYRKIGRQTDGQRQRNRGRKIKFDVKNRHFLVIKNKFNVF